MRLGLHSVFLQLANGQANSNTVLSHSPSIQSEYEESTAGDAVAVTLHLE